MNSPPAGEHVPKTYSGDHESANSERMARDVATVAATSLWFVCQAYRRPWAASSAVVAGTASRRVDRTSTAGPEAPMTSVRRNPGQKGLAPQYGWSVTRTCWASTDTDPCNPDRCRSVAVPASSESTHRSVDSALPPTRVTATT